MEVGNDELVMVAASLDAFLIVEWTLDRFARSVNYARGRYPGLSFNSSSRGGCRDIQCFERPHGG